MKFATATFWAHFLDPSIWDLLLRPSFHQSSRLRWFRVRTSFVLETHSRLSSSVVSCPCLWEPSITPTCVRLITSVLHLIPSFAPRLAVRAIQFEKAALDQSLLASLSKMPGLPSTEDFFHSCWAFWRMASLCVWLGRCATWLRRWLFDMRHKLLILWSV